MKKVDIAKSCERFIKETNDTLAFLSDSKRAFPDKDAHLSRCYEAGIIALYKSFEKYMLKVIVGCVNRDSSTVISTTGVMFGKHINDDVCEFIITGGGYFNFRDRSGLSKILNKFIGKDHEIKALICSEKYRVTLDRLTALRNYAAHSSKQAKSVAMSITSQKSIMSAGSWLKTQRRFEDIAEQMKTLAQEIHDLYAK